MAGSAGGGAARAHPAGRRRGCSSLPLARQQARVPHPRRRGGLRGVVPAPPCHREVDRRADGSRLPLPGDVLRSLARLVQATPLVSRAECADCLSATTRRRAPGERLGPRPGVACREARPPPRFTGRTACLLRTRASRSQRPRGEVAAHRADGARTRRRAAVLLRSHESPPLSGVVLRRDHRWSRIRLSPAIAAEVVCGARLEPATGGGCESVAARRGRARCRASPASDQPRPRMMYASRRVCATPRPLRVRLRPTNCDLAGIYARTRLGLRTDRRKHNIQVLSCQLVYRDARRRTAPAASEARA